MTGQWSSPVFKVTFNELSIYLSFWHIFLQELPSRGWPRQKNLYLSLSLHASLTYTFPHILPIFLSHQYSSTLFHHVTCSSLPLTSTHLIALHKLPFFHSVLMVKPPQSIMFAMAKESYVAIILLSVCSMSLKFSLFNFFMKYVICVFSSLPLLLQMRICPTNVHPNHIFA